MSFPVPAAPCASRASWARGSPSSRCSAGALRRAGRRRPRARGRRGAPRPADGRGAGAGRRDRRKRPSRRPGAQAPGQRRYEADLDVVAGAGPRAAPPARPHPGHARGGPRVRGEAGPALRGPLSAWWFYLDAPVEPGLCENTCATLTHLALASPLEASVSGSKCDPLDRREREPFFRSPRLRGGEGQGEGWGRTRNNRVREEIRLAGIIHERA